MAEKAVSTGNAPVPTGPGAIRNVVLVGPSGSGKTTLLEQMLVAAGAIPRAGRVEDGTTVSDFDEAEKRQQRSVGLSVASFMYEGTKINIIDVPGYADFVGDLRAGLRAADAALFVVPAEHTIDGATRMLWEECAAVGLPRAVVVSKADNPRAGVMERVNELRLLFGDSVLPLEVPLHDDDGTIGGVLDMLTLTVHDHHKGEHTTRPADEEQAHLVESPRGALLEAIIAESEDEALMESYLEGDDLDPAIVLSDLEKAVAHARFHPVIVTASNPPGFGAVEVLDLILRGFPSPLEHPVPPVTAADGSPREPLSADPSGPLVAEIVKTTSDPYVGRLSVARVFSGTLKPDQIVHVSGHFAEATGHEDHDIDEKVGALSSPLGKVQRTTNEAIAGDIVAVARLTRAETSDTLSDKDKPLLMESWLMPEPLHPVAVVAHAKADEDKLSQGLQRLVAEDPTLRLDRNAETGQTVLWTMGEAHVDVLLDRLKNRYGVAVDPIELRVRLRETFGAPAEGHGRLVKQSGGHGQFAVCNIIVEPLPAGSGFEWSDEVVGGTVPRQFIPSVEKGVRAQMEKGVAAGYELVDIKVRLIDGKSHSVDSSDMAFQHAGSLALKDAATKTTISLLEPVAQLTVLVDDEYVGTVMSDLSGRRGRVSGTEPVGTGRTKVTADVPEIELTRYAVDLRSLSHGTGTFTRHYIGHEAMPAHLASKLVESQATH
jgi:elongation factor G